MNYLLFKRWNDFSGWLVFLIAAFVYGMTIEPTASFWDCPEFISCAEKLQVGHPPGAPFYMLVGNLFTQFASDPSQVSRTVNFLNAHPKCRMYPLSFLEYHSPGQISSERRKRESVSNRRDYHSRFRVGRSFGIYF